MNKLICEDLESIKDFCTGILTDEVEDFYYDTRFKTFEEAYTWAIGHNCTHVYDDKENKFIKIKNES